jgi:hypothetical protein
MRHRIKTACTLLALAAGCVDEVDEPIDVPEDPPADEAPAEGSTGRMRVKMDGGIYEVGYVVHGGRAIWQDDIDLGPAPRGATKAHAAVDLDLRWPDGIINVEFSSLITSADRATVLESMERWNRFAPVDFRDTTALPDLLRPRVKVYYGETSHTDGVGAQGGTGPADVTELYITIGAARSTVTHELGHILGFKHEHTRQDRDQFVLYTESCVQTEPDDKTDQFEIPRLINGSYDPSFQSLGGYDFDSVMHYASATWCVTNPPATDKGCWCYPLVVRDSSPSFVDSQDDGLRLDGVGCPSAGDQRAATRMYEPALGNIEADDLHGAAMATGDFDGDGFEDLAVGAPGEERSGVTTGAVLLYRGTESGLQAWRLIDEADVTSTLHDGDEFGKALAAADFDDDGRDDLVIGAPGNHAGVGADTGRVFVLISGSGGPADFFTDGTTCTVGSATVTLERTEVLVLDQGPLHDTPEAGDRFGASLAVGQLTGVGQQDLAIGVPGENGSLGFVDLAVWNQSSGTFGPLAGVAAPTSAVAGDEFGNALVLADLDGTGGRKDLVIGAPAPDSATRPGKVYVYINSASTGISTSPQTVQQPATESPAPAGGDEFGTSLTVAVTGISFPTGLPSNRTQPQILIAAPGKNSNTGRVYVYQPAFSGTTYTSLTRRQSLNQNGVSGISNETNAFFGWAMDATDINLDGTIDLAIGVPSKDLGSADGGAVLYFKGSVVGSGSSATISYSGLGFQMQPVDAYDPAGADGFGKALALGDFDGDNLVDVAIGAPKKWSSAGKAYVLEGDGVGIPDSNVRNLDQEHSTPE